MRGRNRIEQQRLTDEKGFHDAELRDRVDEFVAREEFELALAREQAIFKRAELIVQLICAGKEESIAVAIVDRLLQSAKKRAPQPRSLTAFFNHEG